MTIWFDKYRPKSLDTYIWQNENYENIFREYVNKHELPNMLFVGSPGTGKTTLARALLNEVGIEKSDVLEINGSIENGVDIVKTKINNFSSHRSLSGGMKYVLIDEFERFTPDAQNALRNLIETVINNTRFIFTCNDVSPIKDSIFSRVQLYKFYDINEEGYMESLANILVQEEIEFDTETLVSVVNEIISRCAPDLRKMINELERCCVTGKLVQPTEFTKATENENYSLLLNALVKGDIVEVNNEVVKLSPEVKRSSLLWLFENMEEFKVSPKAKCEIYDIIGTSMAQIDKIPNIKVEITAAFARVALVLMEELNA